MPAYDYNCDGCGPFTAIRPMAESGLPYMCPTCGAEGTRVILTAPYLATRGVGWRDAGPGQEQQAKLRFPTGGHPADCGCCMRRLPIPKWAVSKRV